MASTKQNRGLRAQTAVEYLLLIGAAIVFVTIIAYIVKSAVGGGN